MSDSNKFKFLLAILAILLAHFYPELKKLVLNNFDYLPINEIDTSSSNGDSEFKKESIERDIINSWKSLVQLPKRNTNRSLKIVIGLDLN